MPGLNVVKSFLPMAWC